MVRLLIIAALLLPAWALYSATSTPNTKAKQTDDRQDDTATSEVTTTPLPRRSQTATVYLFLSLHCPISNYYLPSLNRLCEVYSPFGINFVGVVSGHKATSEDIQRHRQRFAVQFPIEQDHDNLLSRQWGATNTPQAIVVDSDNHLIYSGRIDDLYADIGQKRLFATKFELDEALHAIATGQPVTVHHTRPVGCTISCEVNPTHGDVSYHGDVASILYRECVQCHRPGQVAPFSLMTCEDARTHAEQILSAVEQKLMPPWKAAPNYGHFQNEQFLTSAERAIIAQWVHDGMPAGDPSVGPKPPRFRDGWQLGTPDLILTMPETFEVPADGPDIYQHFVLPTGLLKDRLVSAIEFQPGAPEVVHHGGFFIDTEGHARKLDAEDPAPGYSSLGVVGFPSRGSLGSWGPGRMPNRLPSHMGRPLWKNSDIVMQIHYHPVGRPVKDVSRLGVYFAPPEAHQLVCEILVANVDLTIPADASNHLHQAEYVLPVDTTLLNTNPHMHLLGKEAKCYAILQDGSEQPLIHIPKWDFYWQTEYSYRDPVKLPAGTRLILECRFDNSTENTLNFNHPPQTVSWGDNSTDEMAICYFRVTSDTIEGVEKLYWDSSETFGRLWERYQHNKHNQTATPGR